MSAADATTAAPHPPLACAAAAIPAAERPAHRALASRLFAAGAADRRDAADGYLYRLDAARLEEVARWIANERRCCPFLAFALEVGPDDAPLRLRITGPPGTRELLDAELHAPRGADAGRGSR